jgi:flagellar motor protein MotB
MSSKLVSILPVAVLAFAAVGCQGTWVTKEQYDRDIEQLRAFNDGLQKDNALMRPKADAYDQLAAKANLFDDANKNYSEMAEALKKALAGLDLEPGIVTVDNTGKVSFATDVLFELRSWTLTPKGKEAIAKVAPTFKGTVVKIVGHTDKKPIVTSAIRNALETDTNKELSVKRAIAVMGELLKHGIRESQVASVEGHGSDEPKKTDRDSRRVEIYVVSGQVAPAPVKAAFKK